MKILTIKGQNIKADVLVGTNQVVISRTENGRQNSKTILEATASVNGFEITGTQTQTVADGRCSVSYQFDGITFADSHKKIAEYIYIKYQLN